MGVDGVCVFQWYDLFQNDMVFGVDFCLLVIFYGDCCMWFDDYGWVYYFYFWFQVFVFENVCVVLLVFGIDLGGGGWGWIGGGQGQVLFGEVCVVVGGFYFQGFDYDRFVVIGKVELFFVGFFEG